MPINSNTPFITPRELANRWSVSEKTLERWRMHGCGPVYLKIGGRVLYGSEQIIAHERSRMRMATYCALPDGADVSAEFDLEEFR